MEDLLYFAGRRMAVTPEEAGAADATGDGVVDVEDYAIMAEKWLHEGGGLDRMP